MDDRRPVNRSMFWRVLHRSVFANRGRLFVILLALGAGSTVTAALLNLQIDAKRRITSEFRSFGANVLVTPRVGPEPEPKPSTFDMSIYQQIPRKNDGELVAKAEVLYGTAMAVPGDQISSGFDLQKGAPVVVAGYEWSANDVSELFPSTVLAGTTAVPRYLDGGDAGITMLVPDSPGVPPAPVARIPGPAVCDLGEVLASKLHVRVGKDVTVWKGSVGLACNVQSIRRFGGPEDFQLFLGLAKAQKLLGKPEQISVVAVTVPGSATSIASYVSRLQTTFPALEVRPVRQFTETQARIFGRVSGILSATVAVVLLLTALCVMAAMTNIAAERKNDVGLMKAIGGSMRRVLRIFMAEAALMGLTGGLIGAATGIAISIGLGKAVFGVAAQPRLIVYPVSVGLTVIVAILAAYPLRRLANIRPASVFRGEE